MKKKGPVVCWASLVAHLLNFMFLESCCGLESAMVGVFTPQKLANATNRVCFVFNEESQLLFTSTALRIPGQNCLRHERTLISIYREALRQGVQDWLVW